MRHSPGPVVLKHAADFDDIESTSLSVPVHKATGASVRRILLASATRARNLAMLGAATTSAMVLVALGVGWIGGAAFAIGAVAYASLICRDSLNDRFLSTLFYLREESEGDRIAALADGGSPRFDVSSLDASLSEAYRGVVARKCEMEALLANGPAVLRASLRDGNAVCDSLLENAQRLARRGQRLHAYLKHTDFTQLTALTCEAARRVESTNDSIAASTFEKVMRSHQRHLATHAEVEGFYDRVIAQLVLIETTLACAIAKIVKISAVNDEESSMTAYLVNEELEVLISDIRTTEISLEEVAQSSGELGDSLAV